MNFDEYQEAAYATAIYPYSMRIIYPTLGICGESGEIAEKIKKWIRDSNRTAMTDEQLDLLKKELGDVLWYVAALSSDLGLSLGDIAEDNIKKLRDRKERDVIHGSGDTR